MLKVNYTLDKNNVIISYNSIPFSENKPFIIIKDNDKIHIGFDKVIKGVLVPNKEAYEKEIQRVKNIDIIKEELSQLKASLNDSDKKLFQFLEGQIDEKDYEPIKEERQLIRDKIRKLQFDLEVLEK